MKVRWLGRYFRLARYALDVLWRLNGVVERECNLCGFRGRFRAFGHPPRYDACCKQCGSLERHRLLKLWLDANSSRISGARLLHLAPEEIVARQLRSLSREYLSGDIEAGRGDARLDIEKLALEDNSFDVIVCSHILEHVDDRKALKELYRVLRPGGLVLVMVPVQEGWRRTYENADVTSPVERQLHFGQADHVRYYGADLRERLRDAGFEVGEMTAEGPEVVRFGLLRGEKVFICKSPARQAA